MEVVCGMHFGTMLVNSYLALAALVCSYTYVMCEILDRGCVPTIPENITLRLIPTLTNSNAKRTRRIFLLPSLDSTT